MNLSGSKETGWRLSACNSGGNNGDFTIHGYGGGARYSEADFEYLHTEKYI